MRLMSHMLLSKSIIRQVHCHAYLQGKKILKENNMLKYNLSIITHTLLYVRITVK